MPESVGGNEYESFNNNPYYNDPDPYEDDDDDYDDYDDDDTEEEVDYEKEHDYIYKTRTVTLERFDHPEKMQMEYGLNMYSNFQGFSETPQRRAYVIIGSYEEMCEIRNALNKAISEDSHRAKPPVKKLKKKEFNRFENIDVV